MDQKFDLTFEKKNEKIIHNKNEKKFVKKNYKKHSYNKKGTLLNKDVIIQGSLSNKKKDFSLVKKNDKIKDN